MSHALIRQLAELGLLDPDTLEPYAARVRDREDVAALRCRRSGVVVLSRIDHVEDYYEGRSEKPTHTVHGVEVATPRLADNIARAVQFGPAIQGKRWLDFGCGLGGALDEIAPVASEAWGLELNQERAAIVSAKGHRVAADLEELEDASFDVITLFHVLEHLTDPVATVARLKRALAPDGLIIVEVPHARDILLTTYDCEPFRRFTLWSEHLVLHTRDSLAGVLAAGGFEAPKVQGLQRYPLANHLYWLRHGRPGGHDAWAQLSTPDVDSAYGHLLEAQDATDTLVATARA